MEIVRKHWIIRVNDGDNFRNSKYPFWGVKRGKNNCIKTIVEKMKTLINSNPDLAEALNNSSEDIQNSTTPGEKGWPTQKVQTDDKGEYIMFDGQKRTVVKTLEDYFNGFYTFENDSTKTSPLIWGDGATIAQFIPILFNARLMVFTKNTDGTYQMEPKFKNTIYKNSNFIYLLHIEGNH
jgi:hypothetical protein